MTFEQLNLSKPFLRAVEQAGYTQASPIQEKAIPPLLAGKDLLGCAQTGTGKTAAFSLPILQQLSLEQAPAKGVVRALILTPTRELALQIQENIIQYSKFTKLRSVVIFGGVSQQAQTNALRKGADILVATPGRLMDLINQGFIKLNHVQMFVLDEADRMLDMGFIHDVKKIIGLIPEKRQTLLFSATLPPEITKLADSLLVDPVKIFISPESTTVEKIEQRLYKVDKLNKRALLAELLRSPDISSALVFTRTKHGADRVVRDLKREGISALAIHGDKTQGARQKALASFKNGEIRVLVATDIAARGIDINELSHVFNYDLPDAPETYVHRIGRTGRAGNFGVAINFCSFNELSELKAIEKLIGFSIPEITNHAWPMVDKTPLIKNSSQRGRVNKPSGTAKNTNKPMHSKSIKEKKKVNNFSDNTNHSAAPNNNATKQTQNKKPASANENGKNNFKNNGKKRNFSNHKGKPKRPAENPYENRTGGNTIITKTPVWGNSSAAEKGSNEQTMRNTEKNNNSHKNNTHSNKNNKKNENQAQNSFSKNKQDAKKNEIPKNEKGIFDFSEKELKEDTALKVVGRGHTETKYSNFEDFLKNK